MKTLNSPEHQSLPVAPVVSSESSPPQTLSIERFIYLINKGIESWREAGVVLAQLKHIDPSIFKKIMRSSPWLSVETLFAFIKIGESKLHPQVLLLRNSPALPSLFNADINVQKQCCDGPVEIVTYVDDSTAKTERRMVQELSKKQVQLLFHNGTLRTPEQQAAKLRSERIVPKPANPTANGKDARFNPVTLPKELASLGCWVIRMINGEPTLKKYAGSTQFNTQSVLVSDNGGEYLSAVVEIRSWK